MNMLNFLTEKQGLDMQAIIALVREQYPERKDLIVALQNATGGLWTDKAYFQFIDSTNANQPGESWQHDDCIVVEKANIVIDLLKDGRIGGIEFLSLIE